MIPLALDGITMSVWESYTEEDRGDVVERWRLTDRTVFATFRPLGSTRTQTEDGQDVRDLRRITFALRGSETVRTGDRLGDRVSPVWHLEDVRIASGHASCVGVRL